MERESLAILIVRQLFRTNVPDNLPDIVPDIVPDVVPDIDADIVLDIVPDTFVPDNALEQHRSGPHFWARIRLIRRVFQNVCFGATLPHFWRMFMKSDPPAL